MGRRESQKAYEKKSGYAAQNKYHETHTVRINIGLNIKTDADIIAALEGKPKSTELKRLVRKALESEKGTV